MSFTYIPNTTLGQVRLLIGDTVEDSGVLPEGRNFMDEEIDVALERGSNVVNAAAAELLDMAANSWATVVDITMGPLKESYSQARKALKEQAATLREQGGFSGTSFAVDFDRVDGYSEAADEDNDY